MACLLMCAVRFGCSREPSRNTNAPLPGTYNPADSASGVRLFPDAGNIYEYESRGRFQQNQITAGLRFDGLSKARLRANYTLNFAKSNTAGTSSFPSNQFNIDQDYGRADYEFGTRSILAAKSIYLSAPT